MILLLPLQLCRLLFSDCSIFLGLGSIYFNIKFNDSSLNRSLKPTPPVNPGFIPSLISGSTSLISKDVKPVNDSVLEAHCVGKFVF